MSKNIASVQRTNLQSTLDFSNVRCSEVILNKDTVSESIPIGNADVILCGFNGVFDTAVAQVEISIDGNEWDVAFSTKSNDMKHILWAPYLRVSTKGGGEKTNIKALVSRRVK